MNNESTQPLLYYDIDKEIQSLNYDYGVFKNLAEELEKDLHNLEIRKDYSEREITNL
jgi:hypothetical protein